VLYLCLIFVLASSIYICPFPACSCITTVATTLASTSQHQRTHLCRISSIMYNYFLALDIPSANRVVNVSVYAISFVTSMLLPSCIVQTRILINPCCEGSCVLFSGYWIIDASDLYYSFVRSMLVDRASCKHAFCPCCKETPRKLKVVCKVYTIGPCSLRYLSPEEDITTIKSS
jgi:hypothetical protein